SRPGSYPVDRRYTLKQALAKAGGLNIDLSSSDIEIYRRKDPNEEVQTIPVDFAAVLAGSVVDPPIEAEDIIVVPVSTVKYVWNRYVFQILFGGMNIKSFFP
ncbi:MAG: SLBB domain-containing protein, partial [Candidatus Binatia bacterium]|nr:SLBB domain-containing protein [Candidatus Binatia bacterium]